MGAQNKRWTLGLALAIGLFWVVRCYLWQGSLGPYVGDLINLFLPLYESAFGYMASGKMPLWNPYNLCGLPWHATPQIAAFYPSHWLYMLLPSQHALAISHAAHLMLIGLTTASFARRLGLSNVAAALAGLIFAIQGTNQFWMLWPSLLESGSWLALGCIGVHGLVRDGGLRGAGWVALATGMSLLAGYPQVVVFLVYTWASLLLALLVSAQRPRRILVPGALFAGAIVLGASLSAIQLLPTFALTRETARTTEVMGPEAMQIAVEGSAWFLDRLISGSRYSIGALSCALAAAAFLLPRQRAIAAWAGGLGFLVTLLALGGDGWAYPIYSALPAIGWFRDPLKLFLVVHFCTALLSAMALDAVTSKRERAGFPAGDGYGIGLVLALAGGVAVVSAIRGEVIAAAIASATALVIAWRLAPRPAFFPAMPASFASAALIALAVVGAYTATSKTGKIPYRVDLSTSAGMDALMEQLGNSLGDDRYVWLPPRPHRAIKIHPEYGVRGLGDYEPLVLRRQAEYFDYFLYGDDDTQKRDLFTGSIFRHFDNPANVAGPWIASLAARRRLLDLAATRTFVAVRPGARKTPVGDYSSGFAEKAGLLREKGAGSAFVVYENPNALPRAYVTYRTRPARDTKKLLRRISRPRFDPLAVSYIEGDSGFTPAADAPLRGHALRILEDEPTSVEIEADLEAPGLVVLADSYYGDWRASVDGEDATIWPTNHLFRGVIVDAGTHRVRFTYRPWSYRVGAFLSLAALVVLIAVFANFGRVGAARGEISS